MLESRRQLSSGALRASVWPRRLNCVARATGLGDWRSRLEGSVGLSKEDEVVVEATGNAMAGGAGDHPVRCASDRSQSAASTSAVASATRLRRPSATLPPPVSNALRRAAGFVGRNKAPIHRQELLERIGLPHLVDRGGGRRLVDRHLVPRPIRRDRDRCFRYDALDDVVLPSFGRRRSTGSPRFPSLWSFWTGGRSTSDLADVQAHRKPAVRQQAAVRRFPSDHPAGQN